MVVVDVVVAMVERVLLDSGNLPPSNSALFSIHHQVNSKKLLVSILETFGTSAASESCFFLHVCSGLCFVQLNYV